MFDTCVRAVRSVMSSSEAISLLEWPFATSDEDLALALGQRLGRPGAPSRRVRIRFASSRATWGSRWTSPAWARRTATATSSASASLSR